MAPRTEIIDNKIVNYVERLLSSLLPGDIFRKRVGKVQYRFKELDVERRLVVCENLETNAFEEVFFNSPVFQLVII